MNYQTLQQRKYMWLCATGLGLTWLILTILTIGLYPSPWHDEVVWGAVAGNFLQNGNFGIEIWPDRAGLAQNYISVGRLFALYLAITFKIFHVGLIQARWSIAVAAFASGVLLVLALARLYSLWHGLLSATLYLFSWNMFFFSHFVRPEVVGIFLGMGVFYWFVRRKDVWSSLEVVLWGLANTALLDVHLSYIHIFIALSVLLVVDIASRRKWVRLVWLAIGCVLGLCYWAVVHLLPNPTVAVQQFGIFAGPISASSGATGVNFLGKLFNSAQQFKGQFITLTRLSVLQFVLMVASVCVIAPHWRRHWFILLPTASLFFTLFILIPNSAHPDYLVMLIPWVSTLMALAAFEWHDLVSKHLPQLGWLGRYGYAGALLGLLIGYLAGSMVLAWSNRKINYMAMAEQLTELVPQNASVLADPVWFYALYDRKFTDLGTANQILAQQISEPKRLLDELFTERRIEYVVINESATPEYFRDRSAYLAYRHYVADQCHYIGSAAGDLYGVDLGGRERAATLLVYECR